MFEEELKYEQEELFNEAKPQGAIRHDNDKFCANLRTFKE